MEKMFQSLIRRKILVPVFYLILVLVSLGLLPQVTVNYDLAEYLPPDSDTRKAIDLMEEAFGYPGMADVMVEGVTLSEALSIKERIQNIHGVESVLWLDDVMDINQPLQMIPSSTRDSYYQNQAALFKVQFEENDYSQNTSEAINHIRDVLGPAAAVSGPAASSRHMKGVLSNEMLKIILIVIPICVFILMLASASWIEPLIYLGVIGVSIAINMGTNAFFQSISFITQAMAAVLQLAIAMDYSLFLMHRYLEERSAGKDVDTAIVEAAVRSLSSIAASAMTTIAGFLALTFMQYRIGMDIGLVLAKGILISLITVITLMPIVIRLFHSVIEKTSHRPFLPSFQAFGNTVIRLRAVLIAVALILSIPAFLAQERNDFLFGDTSASAGEGEMAVDSQRITETFGLSNTLHLLVPSDDISLEKALSEELLALPLVKDVQGLVTLVDTAIPRAFVPQTVTDHFGSKGYSRFMIALDTYGETPESYSAVQQIKEIAEAFYPGQWHMAGTATSNADIKSTVSGDRLAVNLFSILAVGLIIVLTFRSISLPVILVSVIQASIWVNMSVPYFTGAKLAFIGYLVVSALQLGATIDYAILVTNRYLDFRQELPAQDAAIASIRTAGSSVLVSALILTAAGFSLGLISQIDAISEIGTLIGRGAALSGLMVLTMLPNLLVLLDKVIVKTTMKGIRIDHKTKGVHLS